MRRYLLAASFAAAAVAIVADPAGALMIAVPQPGHLAITSPVVVTGKVTSIATDTVEAASPFAGAKDKLKYKIATVKIDTGLSGIDGTKVKEIKVGFVPPPDPNAKQPGLRPGLRPGRRPPELKEGQEAIFFLAKHPTADFYVIPGISAPFDISTPEGKKTLEDVKKVAATLADPMKGLKSDKADVRAETAAVLVTKYRAYPAFGGEIEEVALPADESKLILRALAEGNWQAARIGGAPNPFMAFNQLGLNEKDGWVPPIIVNVPGQPGPDYTVVMKDAFGKWLEGPGKDYKIKKVVPQAAK
ncbi:hypothetical protein [Frigoriglobus tundricola]|uniref:Uncharacterized protein n=1 Tax=Frigoriglobus tundricola TaxID=2774151 RepID=A0A6M5YS39_9BACT|nr:hypothetical protein [Frigoriglobus tundricola]QJW96818.1 hypothetical protein FTUN_4378 [Frigoriglobus tundricola]